MDYMEAIRLAYVYLIDPSLILKDGILFVQTNWNPERCILQYVRELRDRGYRVEDLDDVIWLPSGIDGIYNVGFCVFGFPRDVCMSSSDIRAMYGSDVG
jgi:hypothetical protein